MSLLAGVDNAAKTEANTDFLGGFRLMDSGAHKVAIEIAYLNTAKSGARSLVMHFKNDTNSVRSTQFFTSGTAKGCKTYYTKDNKNYDLPGYIIVNDIFQVVTGGGLENAVLEEKVIKVYNKEAQGEIPTKVQMVTNLLGKEVVLGVIKQIVDKTALGTDNGYHPTGDTREENEVVKVFDLNGFTVPELAANAAAVASGKEAPITEPTFLLAWKEKNDGVVLNKAKGAKEGGTAGAPATKAAPKKLFK